MTDSRTTGQVEVFTQAHCASCRQLEAYLHALGVAFTERNVDQDLSALDELAARGFMTTPVTRIAGFRKRELERLLGSNGYLM